MLQANQEYKLARNERSPEIGTLFAAIIGNYEPEAGKLFGPRLAETKKTPWHLSGRDERRNVRRSSRLSVARVVFSYRLFFRALFATITGNRS